MKNRLRDNKGYTLVELMAVLVIIGILMAIAGGSIMAYRKHSAFKKNNEYAQTIFTAFQSSLAHAKAGGSLEDLSKELSETEYDKNHFNGRMIDHGAPVPADAEGMYYFFFQKGDKKSEYKGAQKKVYDMIAPYIYDADVLNASFCVEFDPNEGTALGVCYDNQAGTFYYGNTQAKPGENSVNISSRDRGDRYKELVGYYGVDSISSTPEPMEGSVFKELLLVNKETLFLQWKLEDSYRASALNLAYDIKLYDASDNHLVSSFKINDLEKAGTVLPEEGKDKELTLTCDVTLYDKDEKVTKTKKDMKFRSYISKDGKMTLVLDAADLESADQVSQKEPDYDGTYSIQRLGFQGVPMYARMQASGTGYQPSQWEQSNTEHSYFAKEETRKDGSRIFDLNNSRHLFNLRFEEKDSVSETILYRMTGDIVWGGEKGMAAGGFLFDKTKTVTDQGENAPFPSISKLNKNHTLLGTDKDDKDHAVQEFWLGSGSQKTPVGLFEVNEGVIKNLTLEKITSRGTNYVGTVCGVNYGTLSTISVDDKSSVTGKEFVGGIAGSDITGKPLDLGDEKLILVGTKRIYKGLRNSARVTGEKFVGGILGYLYGTYIEDPSQPKAVQKLSVSQCENYGFVTGTRQCIGGIVGYNKESLVEECISAPSLTDGETDELKKAAQRGGLKGDFVGGIAGLNDHGTIVKCSAGKEDQDTFVAGSRFVGGITGFHLKIEDSGIIDSELVMDGNNSVNYANVLGKKYVGGITGVNGSVQGSVSNILDRDINVDNFIIKKEESNSKAVLTNWTNKGIVAAYEGFGGGITGLNTGRIQNCTSQMEIKETSKTAIKKMLDEYGAAGVQIGGIAGYNNGRIENDQRTAVTVYVSGDTYVGGIAGYNEEKGEISNYSEIKGFIFGDDCVGGVAGIHRGEEELKGFENQAEITAVRGDAGGICGQMDKDTKVIDSVNTGNVFSQRGYVGGIAGSGKEFSIEGCNVKKAVISSDESASGGVVGSLTDEAEIKKSSVLPGVWVQNPGGTAGGIVGQTEEDQELEVSDCASAAVLEAKKAGGIIGEVDLREDGVKLKQCRNYGFPAGKTKMSGMIGDKKGDAKEAEFSKCFGVSWIDYPLADNSFGQADFSKCYYFVPEEQKGNSQGAGVPLTIKKRETQSYWAVGMDGQNPVTIRNFTVDPTQLSAENLSDYYKKIDLTIQGYYNGIN